MRKKMLAFGVSLMALVGGGSVGLMTTGCGSATGSGGGCPGAVIVSCADPCPIDCEAQGETTTCVGPDFFDDPDFGQNERCCFCQ